MGRMLEKSDPYIMERKLNYRPANRSCGTCGSEKHSTRTHDKAVSLDTYSSLVGTILNLEVFCYLFLALLLLS